MKIAYVLSLVLINIVKKIKRTILSIGATTLSAVILFSSMTLLFSILNFNGIVNQDRFHYAFYSSEETFLTETKYEALMDGNTGYYGQIHNFKFNLRFLDNYQHTSIPFKITQGTYPKNNHEILVSEELGYSLHDEVTLELYAQDENESVNQLYLLPQEEWLNGVLEEYVVVGLYKQTNETKQLHSTMELIYTTGLEATSYVYYVLDKEIYLNDSLETLLHNADLESDDVIVNYDVISKEKLNYYLSDIHIIVFLFTLIATLGIIISYHAITNVIVATDQERKKELGLIKSVGANPQQVRLMILLEVFILGVLGSIIGILLGFVISWGIFWQVNSSLNITFSWSMLLNPIIILVSFIVSVSIMMLAGWSSYHCSFRSMPISDLKEDQSYNDVPIGKTKKIFNDFQWRMFLIYNERMKKQSRNINHAFILLLLCTSIFSSISLSLKIFENNYESKECDFEIRGTTINPEVAMYLYNQDSMQNLNTSNILYGDRTIKGLTTFRCQETIGDGRFASVIKQKGYDYETIDGTKYYDFEHRTLVLDEFQLQYLSHGPYLVEGDIENLTAHDVLIIHTDDSELGDTFRQSVHVGEEVYLDGEAYNIKAIMVIDKLNADNYHIDTYEHETYCAISLDAWRSEGRIAQSFETIRIKLSSSLDANKVENILNQAIVEAGAQETYTINSLISVLNENQTTTFFFKTLLYPLMGMLFMASMFNLYQVIQSNIYLKRRDISIMKSVGMKPKQLYQLFFFEYLEGYINAAGIVSIIIIPIAILISTVGVADVFDFGGNIIGAQILSIGLLGVLLVLPLILISFIYISKIRSTESLKNQF